MHSVLHSRLLQDLDGRLMILPLTQLPRPIPRLQQNVNLNFQVSMLHYSALCCGFVI